VIATLVGTAMDNLKLLPTCNDSLTMVFPLIDADGAANWLDWRLVATARARRFRGDGSVAYINGCDPLMGITHRGLAAAVGSQFLTRAPNEGATRSAAGMVRAVKPNANWAIEERCAIHSACVAWPNVRANLTAQACRVSPTCDDACTGARRAYVACRSGSG
jgi:hypothetical protein